MGGQCGGGLALHTSTPLNVTLAGASVPVWMLLIGTMFFKQPMSGMQALGSVLSMAGVVVVLTRGDVARFGQIQLVPDDFSAVSSAAFLGEPPELYHALAFALIVCGIVVSSRR